ncbi:hypothetical protein C8Q78DRAFT_140252 [Trametes maxima]|nr:hypothetical protein C8Q78DRAFT_140252 [Trametes maxima]
MHCLHYHYSERGTSPGTCGSVMSAARPSQARGTVTPEGHRDRTSGQSARASWLSPRISALVWVGLRPQATAKGSVTYTARRCASSVSAWPCILVAANETIRFAQISGGSIIFVERRHGRRRNAGGARHRGAVAYAGTAIDDADGAKWAVFGVWQMSVRETWRSPISHALVC